eukprot:15117-Heterococcus_DN1.PRE.2
MLYNGLKFSSTLAVRPRESANENTYTFQYTLFTYSYSAMPVCATAVSSSVLNVILLCCTVWLALIHTVPAGSTHVRNASPPPSAAVMFTTRCEDFALAHYFLAHSEALPNDLLYTVGKRL